MTAKPSSIKVLDNVDELLTLLGTSGPQTIPDIARGMVIPRSSVYRLVDATVHAGYAQVHDDGTIGLAVDLLRLASIAASQNPLVLAAEPVLRSLRDEVGHTVYLCARRDLEVVCLGRYQGLNVGLLELVPGGTLPPHAGATSRVIAAYDDALHAANADPELRMTDRTIMTADGLRAASAEARRLGYVLSDGDVTDGVAAIGIPVFGANGDLSCAISVAGVRDEMLGEFDHLLERLRAAARAINERLERG